MADTLIKLRRSAVPFKIPSDSQLQYGEVAINTFDGKMYFKQANTTNLNTNTILELVTSNFSGNVAINGVLSGTAITQTSKDFTSNRILKVGDFGIGASGDAGVAAPVISDFTQELAAGLYAYPEDTAIGAPSNSPYAGFAMVSRGAGERTAVMAHRITSNTANYKCWFGVRTTANGALIWNEMTTPSWLSTNYLSLDGGTVTGNVAINGFLSGSSVVANTTDSTPGKLLKVGDFGLGLQSTPAITEFNIPLVNGMYRFLGSTANNGPDASAWNHTTLVMHNGSGATALVMRNGGVTPTNARMYMGMRNTANGSFTWQIS